MEVFGATRLVGRDVVINTVIAVSDETRTDPFCRGQIVVLTYPLIENSKPREP